MSQFVIHFLNIAINLPATVYGVPNEKGVREFNCGDVGKPVECKRGALTASGMPFMPDRVFSAAVPMPAKYRIKPITICLRNPENGNEIEVILNDKKNPRFIGNSGLDLSRSAYEALSGKPAKWYSSLKVEPC